ncbi:MAG TPA: C39 family peptidase, partial [Pirellulaceae bacterium]|nr:C39 family peptidase [Pirellulaceae bacterium]
MKLSNELRTKIKELYDQGRYLQAYYASREAGPLWRWTDTDDRVLAGRLAGNLGAERLASLLHRLALRDDPTHWDARYFSLWAISRRRGPLDAWELHRQWGEPAHETAEFRADWHAQRARLASWFRDFSEARVEIDRALELAPERPWIWVEAGDFATAEDRPEDAANAYRKALELRAWYRPAVQALGHSLIQANRLDEAQELLEAATRELESGDVLAILAAIYEERDRHEAALEIWQKLPDYYPLLEYDRRRQQWLRANLADAYYACGDYAAAADCAEKSKSPFHVAIAERLRQPPDDRRQRVVLPVGFTLQHHLTCAPATLTTLSRFWGRPAAHLDVVEAICYDGTPAASERKWAVDQGYLAREFKVTWDVATRLIDAGVPFTLTTIDPGSGHLQAVIGYDRYRETLLMRDPNSRVIGECRGQALLEHYRPTGPRGMVMLPPDKTYLLDGIELPEAELYDQTFTIEMALQKHDRETASAAVERLQQAAPDHRLTLHAVRALARYDGNLLVTFAAIEKLVAQFPEDVNLLLGHLGGLREQGRREERLRILREHCDKPTSDPLIREAYARELSLDHRQNDEAAVHVRKVLRMRALSGSSLSLLADITWAQRDFAKALSYYRLAACIDDKDEDLAKSYFQAARNQSRTNEALTFIQDRAARYERRSTAPSRTVVWALEQFDRTQEAAQVIERAIAAHPDDGEFLLFAARFSATYGDLQRATERL